MQLDLLAGLEISGGTDQGEHLLVRVSRQLKAIGPGRDTPFEDVAITASFYGSDDDESTHCCNSYGEAHYFTLARAELPNPVFSQRYPGSQQPPRSTESDAKVEAAFVCRFIVIPFCDESTACWIANCFQLPDCVEFDEQAFGGGLMLSRMLDWGLASLGTTRNAIVWK